METHEHHSFYKGFEITKVTQDNGRVTYDYHNPSDPFFSREIGFEKLAVCRADIRASL